MEGKTVLGEVLSRKIKKENNKPTKSSYGYVQQEFLKIYKKKCCHSKCDECGIKNRLEPFACPLQISDTKRVSYKKYVNQVFDDLLCLGKIKFGYRNIERYKLFK